MALTPGTRLGPYEILAPLGAGGMGEVYRAMDTRLDRAVAIKILPAHVCGDGARKQRFEREAKTLSRLNHPHICVLHDIGHEDGVDYLVMECVEGETLAKRLEKGPLGMEQVLRYGGQMADALETAHRHGVVHRDLKPGNVMLTGSGAKLLDFGLAKPAAFSSLSTMGATKGASPLTAEGTIAGTLQYMSPEQVEGKELDRRSDIFSLGAVLYEMLTGKRAFEGKSQLSVISAILEKEPPAISTIQPLTPPALDHAIRRCLAKDPEERWQTARDLSLELKWIGESGAATVARPGVVGGGKSRQKWGWLVAGLLFAALIGAISWRAGSRQEPPAMYFHSPVPFSANDLALSPDGQTAALVAYGPQTNSYVIWTYKVGGRDLGTVPGSEGASHPFWSADGKSIGFFAEGKLKKVEAFSGEAPQVLCDAPNGRGGTWNREGVILFSPKVFGGLYRVPASGGVASEVTRLDAAHFASSDRWPVFLPDQRHFLYLESSFGGDFEQNAIFAGSLDSSEKQLIVKASANAAYAEPGYLLYVRDKALVAQRFDAGRLALSGEARTLSDEVQIFPQIDLALFGVRGKKTLLVQSGTGLEQSQLEWFDRRGKQTGLVGAPGLFANPSLSRDGRYVAFELTDRGGRYSDIWIQTLANNAVRRFTFGPGLNQMPIWSPDGRRIAFFSDRRNRWFLSTKNADGSGGEQQLRELKVWGGLWDWSRDGRYLLTWEGGGLGYLRLEDGQEKALFDEQHMVRNAQFSPDDRWVAYSSNESGNREVYVSPFPSMNGKWQVSRGGGREPRWRADGKELFYVSAGGKLMAVTVKTSGNFEAESPEALFQTRLSQPISGADLFSYDVSGDGQRFLINSKVEEAKAAPLLVILNWASDGMR